jgi:hypothetical protein
LADLADTGAAATSNTTPTAHTDMIIFRIIVTPFVAAKKAAKNAIGQQHSDSAA